MYFVQKIYLMYVKRRKNWKKRRKLVCAYLIYERMNPPITEKVSENDTEKSVPSM